MLIMKNHTRTTHTLVHLVLALTLAALAGSVFAQDATTTADEDVAVGETVLLEDTESADTANAGATTTEAILTPPPTQTIEAGGLTVPVDNYPRETLGGREVYNDFVVGPGRFELQLAPGQSRTVELMVSNRMGEGKVFSFDIEDAEASDTTDGGIELLGGETGPYTIKDFISVPYEDFYLEANTRARIPVTISLPPDAEPGGRYGSILTSIISREVDDGAAAGARPATVIVSRIATLFFVTTPGEIDRQSELIDFATRNNQTFFSTGPIQLDIVTENFGTVHTNPSGMLTITNMLGEEVGLVELERWFVMPNSVRTRTVDWDREALFGRYTATVEVNRGYGEIVDIMSVSFWVIPIKVVVSVFTGLFVFFLLLRFIFSRFEFKRK